MTIWDTLPKPLFVLAPMEDVTDTVFRQILLTTGRPDVFFTEFTNVDGLVSQGEKEVAKRLVFTLQEKPIVAQIWGMKPENYFKVAGKLADMGYDGIDINMGCPQADVVRHGACSALMKNHSLALEIIQATKEGSRGLPVSVKTRIGYATIQTEEWIGFLLDQDLPLLTVHGRTVKEMSKVPAHWDEIGKAVSIRNEKKLKTLIFGNGDVQSLGEAREKVREYGVDGVMIGRGIFHNPWLFNETINTETVSLEEKVQLLLKHVTLWQDTWADTKHFPILKKYFKIYVSGFDGAAEIRQEFMQAQNPQQVKEIAKKYL